MKPINANKFKKPRKILSVDDFGDPKVSQFIN